MESLIEILTAAGARTSVKHLLSRGGDGFGQELFKEKLAVPPISQYFPDVNGSSIDFDAAAGFFANRFHRINLIRDRKIYVHYTNAVEVLFLNVVGKRASHSSE